VSVRAPWRLVRMYVTMEAEIEAFVEGIGSVRSSMLSSVRTKRRRISATGRTQFTNPGSLPTLKDSEVVFTLATLGGGSFRRQRGVKAVCGCEDGRMGGDRRRRESGCAPEGGHFCDLGILKGFQAVGQRRRTHFKVSRASLYAIRIVSPNLTIVTTQPATKQNQEGESQNLGGRPSCCADGPQAIPSNPAEAMLG
jgi:hypothetical protein